MQLNSTTGAPRRKSAFLASAAIAVSVTALAALESGSAHAFPLAPPEGPCDSWHLNDRALTIDVGDPFHYQISIDWDANSGVFPSTAETNARWLAGKSSRGTTLGNASGNGGPTTSVDLSFDFSREQNDRPTHFSGKIDPQFGSVTGSVTFARGARFDGVVQEHFQCVHHAAAPAAPAPNQPAPAPAPAPAPPVINAIQLQFGPPHLGGITATITNSSALTAKCTYDSTPFNTHRDFTVAPNGKTDLTFTGINTNTNYHVVVSCHDASGKQTQEIGHQETNVAF
jgi:hypothetical protein